MPKKQSVKTKKETEKEKIQKPKTEKEKIMKPKMEKKKIIMLLLLSLVVIITIVVIWYSLIGRSVKFKITPSETKVQPGDIITYKVKIGSIKNLASMKFKIVIPEGLTFIEGQEVDGLKTQLNAAKAEFTESTKVFVVGSSDYTSIKDTLLMTFKCSVDEDATGKKDITLIIDENDFFDTSTDMENIPVKYSNLGSTISIEKAN